MKREDIKEYLDCNGFEALTSFDGTKYYNEEVVIAIALEVVKNCSIPPVVKRSEQLVCVGCGRTEKQHTGYGKDICPNNGGQFKAN
jgi:rRNA maturation endonuclease Nob1